MREASPRSPDEHPAVETNGRWLRYLSREEFARHMGMAIEVSLTDRGGIHPNTARYLRWEALKRFFALAQARTRRVRRLTKTEVLRELERTHGTLLENSKRMAGEITSLESQLERARAAEPPAGLANGAALELDLALEADLRGLFTGRKVPDGLSAVVAREHARRAAAVAKAVEEQRSRVDVLERRIAKMRAAQEQMELQLAELERLAQIDHGVASLYKDVQGLTPEAAQFQRKSELLTCIFEQNLAFQKRAT